jgi:hypothetical protein
MLENSLWTLVVAGGPLLLAIVFAWVLLRRRPLTPGERVRRDQATRRLYRDTGKDA